MDDDKTVPRTIWTDTLLDMLGSAIKQQNEAESKKILREIKHKGYRKAHVLQYGRKHLEPGDAKRLERLVNTGSRKRAS